MRPSAAATPSAGTVTVAYPNGFPDHSNLTANTTGVTPGVNVFPGGTPPPNDRPAPPPL